MGHISAIPLGQMFRQIGPNYFNYSLDTYAVPNKSLGRQLENEIKPKTYYLCILETIVLKAA